MEINNHDLRLILLGCFRYSLGRMTYMPIHTKNTIKRCKEVFNETDWNRFIEEIKSADSLGMDCDKKTWMELVDFSKEQIASFEDSGKLGGKDER